MLNLLRLLFAIFAIVLIVPQTPKANIVLKKLNSKYVIASYSKAKRFLKNLTWFCIISFLAISFFTSVK